PISIPSLTSLLLVNERKVRTSASSPRSHRVVPFVYPLCLHQSCRQRTRESSRRQITVFQSFITLLRQKTKKCLFPAWPRSLLARLNQREKCLALPRCCLGASSWRAAAKTRRCGARHAARSVPPSTRAQSTWWSQRRSLPARCCRRSPS
ncbi:unnamed protein product, partial [Phaeothamnion confervicola]